MKMIDRHGKIAVTRLRRLRLNLHKLLLAAIVLPSAFVVAVSLLSFLPHQEGLLSHGQEHVALALVMVGGIVPFSFLMLGIFRRVQREILRQNQELSRRTKEMEALLRVGKAVEESVDLGKVLSAALGAVVEVTNAEVAEVWLVDPGGGGITLRRHEGAAREAFMEITHFAPGEGYPGIVAQTGVPLLVHDLTNDARFLRQRVKDEGFHTLYALPLRHAGDTVGVLTVSARDPAALTSRAEMRLLGLMAEQIACAVENARLHGEVETLAIHTERQRLAREMHDGLAQVLGYVSTKAQAVKELLKSGRADIAVQHMEQLEVAAQETYDDVREAILALGTNGHNRPLLDLLRDYVERFSEMSDIPAELVIEGTPATFKPGVEVQLLRIVQESLANVRKHARASRVRVQFTFDAAGCRLAVEDDGQGFEPGRTPQGPRPHLGLQSMQERADAIGARLTVDSSPGKGTRVAVELSGADA